MEKRACVIPVGKETAPAGECWSRLVSRLCLLAAYQPNTPAPKKNQSHPFLMTSLFIGDPPCLVPGLSFGSVFEYWPNFDLYWPKLK
jgi:hypothetical protein